MTPTPSVSALDAPRLFLGFHALEVLYPVVPSTNTGGQDTEYGQQTGEGKEGLHNAESSAIKKE